MPDYTITPDLETHEFTVRDPLDPRSFNRVTLFPRPRCTFRFEGEGYPCTEWEDMGNCSHTRAVERTLIDARNAPERPENKLLIETAYIPIKVAHRRSQGAKKGIVGSPIDDVTKRQDWMD